MDNAGKPIDGLMRGHHRGIDNKKLLARSSTYWGRGRFRSHVGSMGTSTMDTQGVMPDSASIRQAWPYPQGTPLPQTSHKLLPVKSDTSRSLLEDNDGFIRRSYEELD